MSLKLISIASGSKGNATLIMSDNTAVLLDCGVSFSRLQIELNSLGLSVDDLDGVVITHEHSDHIRAVKQLDGFCQIYAHPLTRRAIVSIYGPLCNAPVNDGFELGFEIGDIHVQPFRIPHDAVYPLAYSFSCGGARCSVATDIGVPTYGVLRNIHTSQVVLLEANHDEEMLREGNYPVWLKKRILSDKGHLSNRSAAKVAAMLSGNSDIEALILGHISENNNTEQLAYSAVSEALEQKGDKNIRLALAHQNMHSEVFEIR